MIAVGLVTWMIFWMRRTARSLSGELLGKVGTAMKLGAGALTLTAFFAVAREGMETMLFLWTATRADPVAPLVAGHPWQTGTAVVLAPAIVAAAAALALPASRSNTTGVAVTETSCGDGCSGTAVGRHTFAVQNTSAVDGSAIAQQLWFDRRRT